MTMMRIAIAGSGGLAQHFAHFINQTSHPFIILSRAPHLEDVGYQVVVVDYDSQRSLQFALQGTDLVISTVSESPQINLIDAASRAGVRRFVPAEFEGPPTRRDDNDPFDRGRAACLQRLQDYSRSRGRRPMQFTTFTCGIFYERFSRGGLASKGVGLGSGLEHQGAYLMDVGNNTAEIIEYSSIGQPVQLCMTCLSDVARFLVAALDLGVDSWPAEFRMRGDRKTVTQLLADAENIKGGESFHEYAHFKSLAEGDSAFEFYVTVFNAAQLAQHLQHALTYQDHARAVQLQALAATADRHYDFSAPTLNDRVSVEPVSFKDWLRRSWGL